MEAEKPDSPKDEKSQPAGGGGGWGGWGLSSLSLFSDLQKAASVAAEEISRNAVAAAKNAAKGISDLQANASVSESAEKDRVSSEDTLPEGNTEEDETARIRKSALDRLEKASEDSLLGQGLKVLDHSVENLASGAWNALGSAWKGGSELVHKLEHSAANLAEPVKAGSFAPSILETGKSLTSKGIQVLERVGKETMELIISETGLEVEKDPREMDQQIEDEHFEEVTFDRCFYIYGGPDHVEELEALSNHYALLFNRRKAKLSSEMKSLYDGKLKHVQQIFSLGTEIEEAGMDTDKGKNVELTEEAYSIEMKVLRNSSISKAADMASGFTTALAGLAASEILQLTADRLETINSEGVHRLSELCCFAVSQLLMLGKSVIANANKSQREDAKDDILIDWPEDSVSKAKIIRFKAQSMTRDVEAVSNSFITGISDINEAYLAAIRGANADAPGSLPQHISIQEKADAISDHLRAGQTTALDKIQDSLRYLAYVVLATSVSTV